jgi:hypothetical protein
VKALKGVLVLFAVILAALMIVVGVQGHILWLAVIATVTLTLGLMLLGHYTIRE